MVAERTRLGRMTTSMEDLRARAGTNMHTWLTPNIWSGMVHLTYGSAWVGSYDDIAALFEEYARVGVSIFQIYGYPFLEEAYHVGERVIPIVRERSFAILRGGPAHLRVPALSIMISSLPADHDRLAEVGACADFHDDLC